MVDRQRDGQAWRLHRRDGTWPRSYFDALSETPRIRARERRELDPTVPSAVPAISETLEELAREGARRTLERALTSEVDVGIG